MGFFKFLKKKGERLDIPPPPPPPEMLKTGVPLTPKENLPTLPKFDIPPIAEEKEQKTEEKVDMPELPPMPEFSVPQPKESGFEPIKQEPKVIHPFREQEKPAEIKEKPKKIVVKEEKEELKQKEEITKVVDERHFLTEPIFVKTWQYRDILNGVNVIKNKVNECNFIVENLNEIKNKKDKEFGKWRSKLEDMQRKVSLLEKSLFEVAK